MAATPSQSLDMAIKAMETTSNYRLDMDMNVDTTAIHLDARFLDKQTGEGNLTYNQLVNVDWKMIGTMLYFRFGQAPSFIPESYIGTWIGMEASKLPTEVISNDLPQNIAGQSAIRKLPIFQVLRIEKKLTNAAGDNIQRLRVRINPTVINAVRLSEIKALPRDKNYYKNLSALNKRYAKLRVNLAKLFMAINLNVTKNRVERMEIGGTIDKNKIAVGINLSSAENGPIFVPFNWKTLEEMHAI